jgi:hypothetical protein
MEPMMIDKPIYLHLTHATGNNITKRKRAGEVSARAGESCAMSSPIGMEHAARRAGQFRCRFRH